MRAHGRAVLVAVTIGLVALGCTANSATANSATARPARTTPDASRSGSVGVMHGIVDDHPAGATESAAKRQALRRAASAGPTAPFATSTKTVNVTVQKQATDYYCAPASGRVAVSALVAMASLPPQKTLAGRMGTTASGTTLSKIAPALNAYQSKNTYVYVAGLDLAGFRARVRGGIDTYSAPQIAPVQMSRLPWYAGTGISGNHAITDYGYIIVPKSWEIHVYDPWDGVRHTSVSSAAMFRASLNNDLIW
jgi:hypothetical protein